MDRRLHLQQLDHVGLPFTREGQPPFVSICISILNDRQVKRDKWLHLLEPQLPLLRQGGSSPAPQSRGEQGVKAVGEQQLLRSAGQPNPSGEHPGGEAQDQGPRRWPGPRRSRAEELCGLQPHGHRRRPRSVLQPKRVGSGAHAVLAPDPRPVPLAAPPAWRGRSSGYRVSQTWVPMPADEAHASVKCAHITEPQFPRSEEDGGARAQLP